MTEFDLEAFVAERTGAPFKFRFGKHRFTLPPAPDVRAIAAYDGGRYDECLLIMLGAEQYQQFLEAGGLVTREGLLELLKRQAAQQATTLGESSASTRSSSNTRRPSKRTSSATTKLR